MPTPTNPPPYGTPTSPGDPHGHTATQWVDPTQPGDPTHRPNPVDAALLKLKTRTEYIKTGFYIAALLVALTGQITGAMGRLGLPWFIAAPGVAVLELCGIVILAQADVRRRLGEAATGYRIMSAGIASFAIAFNWLAHADHLLGGFFSGMSALGYVVWLMGVEDKRRDRQREIGHGAQLIPSYPWWMRLSHPQRVARARLLARQTIEAGGTMRQQESLTLAKAALAEEHLIEVVAGILSTRLGKLGPLAEAMFDPKEVARDLAKIIDPAALVTMLAAEINSALRTVAEGEPNPPTQPTRRAKTQPADPTTGDPTQRPTHNPTHTNPPTTGDPTRRPNPRPNPTTRAAVGSGQTQSTRPNPHDARIEMLASGETVDGSAYPNWERVTPTQREIADALGLKGGGTSGRIRDRMVARIMTKAADDLPADLAKLR